MPNETWHQGTRTFPDGQKWFDWISTSDKISFSFLDRDFFPFDVEIRARDDDEKFKFERLTFRHCDPDAFQTGYSMELGPLRLYEEKGKLILESAKSA